jgi:hypothetical protein
MDDKVSGTYKLPLGFKYLKKEPRSNVSQRYYIQITSPFSTTSTVFIIYSTLLFFLYPQLTRFYYDFSAVP